MNISGGFSSLHVSFKEGENHTSITNYVEQ